MKYGAWLPSIRGAYLLWSFVTMLWVGGVEASDSWPVASARGPEGQWLGATIMLFIFCLLALVLLFRHRLAANQRAFDEALEQKQQVMNTIFWATGDTLIDSDLVSGKALYLNLSLDFPYSERDVHFRSETFLNLIHEEDRALVRSRYASLLQDGESQYELHYRIATVTHSYLWLVEKGYVLSRDLNGKALRIVSNFRDISDLMQEQEKLARLTHELKRRLKLAEATQESD